MFFFAADTTGTQTFQQVLEQAFNLVIGIEFIKMLAKHTPGSAIEVLLFAMARQLVIGHMTPVENLLGVIAIGIIFIIRKFCLCRLLVHIFRLTPQVRKTYRVIQ